jgi:hypothetical protein
MTVQTPSESTPETVNDVPRRVFPGLCSVCKLGVLCTYPRSLELPVWQCEEFEGFAPLVRPVKHDPCPDPKLPAANPAEKDEQYAGLCRTCSIRSLCACPRPIGGVWHCEEFQ